MNCPNFFNSHKHMKKKSNIKSQLWNWPFFSLAEVSDEYFSPHLFSLWHSCGFVQREAFFSLYPYSDAIITFHRFYNKLFMSSLHEESQLAMNEHKSVSSLLHMNRRSHVIGSWVYLFRVIHLRWEMCIGSKCIGVHKGLKHMIVHDCSWLFWVDDCVAVNKMM